MQMICRKRQISWDQILCPSYLNLILDEEEDDPEYQSTCIKDAELQFSDEDDNSTGKYK